MATKKGHWFWNLVMVLTAIVCISALVMHYKNWVKLEATTMGIRSGFYSLQIPYSEIDSVVFVARISPMQRLNGFSAMDKEKGIFRMFKDSLTDRNVHVLVDNISQQKIKLVYKDSLTLYLNLKDSVETLNLYHHLEEKLTGLNEPN